VSATGANVDREEVAKFEAAAARWWDPAGQMRPLHEINPLRLAFVAERAGPLAGRRVADVGCGGGILAEAMAREGAEVTGIDASEAALRVARLHAAESGVKVDYQPGTAEALAAGMPGAFDIVTCMELIEHVPDPASLIQACARLARPGGHVFFSTLNRTPKAWLLAVVGAEYVLGLLPRGTHDWRRFVRPSELDAWARGAGLELAELAGLRYDPLLGRHRLTRDVSVNYLAWYRKGNSDQSAARIDPH